VRLGENNLNHHSRDAAAIRSKYFQNYYDFIILLPEKQFSMATNTLSSATSGTKDLEQLLRQGLSNSDIEQLLMKDYKDEFLVEKLMVEVKKLRNAQKTSTGLTLVLSGAFLMLMGFLCAFITGSTETLLYVFLYGFTSIGLVIAFLGLAKVLN